jgi:EAL domain-containing protein (putative c-di-GMP-specific phosphodiesterase class I)/GGDEF domain-containing protein
MTDIQDISDDKRGELLEIIEKKRITPYFQPVVDLFSGQVYGFEALSRAGGDFANPALMFGKAHEWNLSWELESVCRSCALEKIARFPEPVVGKRKFFINFSRHTFSDPRFQRGFTSSLLDKLGVDRQRIVIDIRESSALESDREFEEVTSHYTSQGFRIALDNFGSGQTSLLSVMTASPHYLKLDRRLVSSIQDRANQQTLIKSIISFASSVGCKLIAEGIETLEELETLVRLGVRYGQGFYLGRPEPEPAELRDEVRDTLQSVSRRFHYPRMASNATIVEMAIRPPAFEKGTLTCAELDQLFRKQHSLDHVVVVSGRRPAGIVTRNHLWALASGPRGYAEVADKTIDRIMKTDILVVKETMDLRVLGRFALDRERDEQYDPIIVTQEEGLLVGTITMKQLLAKSIDIEIEIASNSNPLTNLPGNMMIQKWLHDAVQTAEFSLIYGDLDKFKEYNDCYGFSQGDEMIKLCAAVLMENVEAISPNARLGHVGGDDFVVVASGSIQEEALTRVCEEFDRRKVDLFDANDVKRGFYVSTNRQGLEVRTPLVTLSLAALTEHNTGPNPHPAQFGQISASLKKKIKATNAETGRSGYLRDRRRAGAGQAPYRALAPKPDSGQ